MNDKALSKTGVADDLDDFLSESLEDPAFRAAYEDAEARSALIRTLASCRQGAGLSQGAVASLMATTQSAISELEGGATDPRLSTLQRYSRSVGCRLRVLLEGSPSEFVFLGSVSISTTAVHALLPPIVGLPNDAYLQQPGPAVRAIQRAS